VSTRTTAAERRPGRLPVSVWCASAASCLATGADTFLLFTVVWVAAPQGWTGAQTAAVVLALRLPALAGGLVGGLAVERWGSRRVVRVETTARATLMVALAALSRDGELSMNALLVLGAVAGAMSPATYAAVRTAMPHLVERGDLPRANTAVSLGDQVQLLAGSALVGPALLVLGPRHSPLVAAGLLLLAGRLGRRLPPATGRPPIPAPDAYGGQAGGPRGLPARVCAIVALSTAYYFVYGPFETATPPFVRNQLGAGEGAYSLLWALFSAGALATLPLAPALARHRPGMVNALGAVAWGAVMLPLAFVDTAVAAAAVFFLGGAVWGPYTAVEATALHRWVDPSRHGRVFGVQRSLLATAVPLGAASGALALERFSPVTVLMASAAACCLAGLAALTMHDLRAPT
jgi:predicted MFS family arabinose efflux permease